MAVQFPLLLIGYRVPENHYHKNGVQVLTFYIRAWNTALRLCCEVLSQGALLLAMGTPATSAWGGFGGNTPEGPQTGQGSSGSNTGKSRVRLGSGEALWGVTAGSWTCQRHSCQWTLHLKTALPQNSKSNWACVPLATPRSHVTLAGQLCSPLICIQGKIPQKGKGHTPLITNGCYIGRGGAVLANKKAQLLSTGRINPREGATTGPKAPEHSTKNGLGPILSQTCSVPLEKSLIISHTFHFLL